MRGMCGEAAPTITAILPRSKWSCLLPRVVLYGASEVMKVYPLVKLKVFVNDITAFLKGRNKELPSIVARSRGQ